MRCSILPFVRPSFLPISAATMPALYRRISSLSSSCFHGLLRLTSVADERWYAIVLIEQPIYSAISLMVEPFFRIRIMSDLSLSVRGMYVRLPMSVYRFKGVNKHWRVFSPYIAHILFCLSDEESERFFSRCEVKT